MNLKQNIKEGLFSATLFLTLTFVATHAADETNYVLTEDWAVNQVWFP